MDVSKLQIGNKTKVIERNSMTQVCMLISITNMEMSMILQLGLLTTISFDVANNIDNVTLYMSGNK